MQVGIAADQDARNADSTMLLVVGIFGAVDGVVVEVDYAQIHEYVATPQAPPGISSCVQLRNSAAMDAIFGAASVIAQHRGQMFQAPGDKTIMSVPRGGLFAAESRVSAEGRSTKAKLVSAVMRSTGKSFTAKKAEGFFDFDWLHTGRLGDEKNGFGWNFTDDKQDAADYRAWEKSQRQRMGHAPTRGGRR
jgi:hypothetical protein